MLQIVSDALIVFKTKDINQIMSTIFSDEHKGKGITYEFENAILTTTDQEQKPYYVINIKIPDLNLIDDDKFYVYFDSNGEIVKTRNEQLFKKALRKRLNDVLK